MGKAQSKRSIDITTDPKKVGEGDEVAGKVEKIEDVDQQKAGDVAAAPPLNGDAANPKEGEEVASEKKDTEDHSENDKDLTTEKSASEAKADAGASGDAPAETSKDEAAAGSPKDSAGAEAISPLADESMKVKSKKDKVKKKWSFRNLSFGKKDKQKPAKTEDPVSPTAAAAASPEATPASPEAAQAPTAEGSAALVEPTTNGEAPEQPKETPADKPATPKDEVKPVENGSASAQEEQAANGGGDDKRPSTPPTVEVPAAKPEEIITAATTTEPIVNPPSTETAAKESTAPEVVTNGHGTTDEAALLTNGDKNGLAESPVVESAVAAANIPSKIDDEEPHQNGTNGISSGSATPPPTPVAVDSEAEQIKNKSQIEVNQIDITPSNSSNNAHNNNNNNNNTVNTSTKLLTTTTETTENNSTTIITTTTTTTTETENIAAADLVQTQTNTVPTIPTPTPPTTTDTTTTDTNNTTTTTTTTTTNITDTLHSRDEPEVKASRDSEEVVQAIIAAVSSETDAAEGFVVIAATELENESNIVVSSKPESDSEIETEIVPVSISETVLAEASNPPPLPKSPPPSRVSAFALAEDDDVPAEIIDNEKYEEEEESKANAPDTEIVKNEKDISPDIEQQAQIIVDEITEQAAEIVKNEQDQKDQADEESKKVLSEDLISNEITDEVVLPVPVSTEAHDTDADSLIKLPENVEEKHVPEEIADTQIDNDHHDPIEISIDHLTAKLEALPRINGDDDDVNDDNDDDDKANDDDLNELDRNNKDITKDLKEKNAAAADVTTQDLAVTCE